MCIRDSYNIPNVLAAVCIGIHFKIPNEKIIASIENYSPSNSRSQLVIWNNNEVILDAYNANPSSMKVAIENFSKLDKPNKVICLGGMKELGHESKMEHQILIDQLQQYHWKQVILVGGDFISCQHPYLYFETAAEAKHWLQEQKFSKHTLLIKGSRGIQMEQLIA